MKKLVQIVDLACWAVMLFAFSYFFVALVLAAQSGRLAEVVR